MGLTVRLEDKPDTDGSGVPTQLLRKYRSGTASKRSFDTWGGYGDKGRGFPLVKGKRLVQHNILCVSAGKDHMASFFHFYFYAYLSLLLKKRLA